MDNQHRELEIDDDWLVKTSRRLVRILALRPRGLVRFVLVVGAAALLGWSLGGSRVLPAVGGAAVGVVVLGLIYSWSARRIRAAMYEFGFRPGRFVRADYDDTGFVISTDVVSRRREYADIRRVEVRDRWVRLRTTDRLTVVLPRDLMPDDRLDRMRAMARSRPISRGSMISVESSKSRRFGRDHERPGSGG